MMSALLYFTIPHTVRCPTWFLLAPPPHTPISRRATQRRRAVPAAPAAPPAAEAAALWASGIRAAAMAAQKINEGLEHLAKAEKYLFHAAKAYEQAGMMLKEMQKLPEAVQLIEKASMMYLENGTPDTAAMALERAGKLIENVDPEKAVQLYQQTANVFENEERLRQAVELLGKASRLLVRGRRFDEAAISIQKEKNIYKEIENYPTCYKKTIAQVLVHLHRNDYVAAERCVRESYSIPGFNGSEDCAALEQLLEGYDQQDQDQVSEVCNSPLFKYMDNDYAKLGLSLVVPGGGIKKKSPATPQAKPEGVSAAAAEEEEDEYSGGLC
ncbi:Gamma-soluble NSF attachment protein [Sciurus carolinensis]|uniref:Gamma-soluble NSF attachment protein n=1 Tax=Sciurus carolinensis TaxID=30640 RepID=A0AA41MJR3_SCICA|nr:Gamma-soluble NSF attachment protein [Sciurus carolinensis]